MRAASILHDEWVELTPFGILRGCAACGPEVLGYTPLLLPCTNPSPTLGTREPGVGEAPFSAVGAMGRASAAEVDAASPP